jgi:hypothetical protein
VGSALLAWLIGGSALAALAKVLLAVCGLVFGLIYRRYLGILGADRRKPAERQAYDALRNSLAEGNMAARLYAERLTRFLDWIDRFFGDAGMADRTLFPHAFGLRTPAPLWTAPAFDRCLLLALIYPVATILIIWAISGHVGPAERALGLRPDLSGWQRSIAVAGLTFAILLCWRGILLNGWKSFVSITTASIVALLLIDAITGLSAPGIVAILAGTALVSVAGAIIVAIVFALVVGVITTARHRVTPSEFGAGVVILVLLFTATAAGLTLIYVVLAVGGAVIVVVAVAGVGAGTVAIALIIAVVAAILVGVVLGKRGDRASTAPGAIAVVVAVTITGAGAAAGTAPDLVVGSGPIVGIVIFAVAFGAAVLSEVAREGRWQAAFPSLLTPAMVVVCLVGANLLAPLSTWEQAGPILLFLGLLTLLNAPFDWASLGLTRALLRRGLEIGGWWPYALALLDAGLAALVIAALALTMVVGVQTFDALAVHGGGASVLPLEPLLNGIAAQPSAPEYWWLYALLLSTMIPSLVNLVIGGSSLLRGLPGVPMLLLRAIPARGGVLRWDRHWIATVLTAQVAAGAALGIAAQAFLVVVIIGYVMPWFGADLLGMAHDVADFNLPERVGQLFGVSL